MLKPAEMMRRAFTDLVPRPYAASPFEDNLDEYLKRLQRENKITQDEQVWIGNQLFEIAAAIERQRFEEGFMLGIKTVLSAANL